MVPVINQARPKLREAFEYAHVHDNTVLIDRRTKWVQAVSDRANAAREGGRRSPASGNTVIGENDMTGIAFKRRIRTRDRAPASTVRVPWCYRYAIIGEVLGARTTS